MGLIIALPIACCSWAEDVAHLKGHNGPLWKLGRLIFGPFALLALIAYPDLEDRRQQRNSAAELSSIKDEIAAMRRSI